MKLRSLIASVVMVAAAKAATVTVTNIDATTNAVTNQAGTIYAAGTGFVGIGVFSITDAQIAGATSSATIANGFTLFGQSAQFGAGFDVAGTYQFESTAPIAAGSPFTGSMYTVIGNAATLAASTQFLVYKHTTTFAADPTPASPAFLHAGQGQVILGGFGNFNPDLGAGAAPGFNTVTLVPEPSAALLGLLGAVGLFRRRR